MARQRRGRVPHPPPRALGERRQPDRARWASACSAAASRCASRSAPASAWPSSSSSSATSRRPAPRATQRQGCPRRRSSSPGPYAGPRCPRATRSTTPRAASARSSRASCPEIAHPSPRLRGERWPEKLAGRAVASVDAHGKHLFLRFDGDLTIHSHLRMTGSWGTYRDGQRWRRAPRRAWLVLRTDARRGRAVRRPGARADDRVAHALRPPARRARPRHPRAASSTSDGFLRRLREDDPTRPIGDALLDQRTIAGIGNLWKCEGCFAAGIDPWRPDRRRHRRRGAGDRARDAARGCSSPRRDGMQDAAPRHLRQGRAALPALRRADPQPRPGRRQPPRRTGARGARREMRASATRAPT